MGTPATAKALACDIQVKESAVANTLYFAVGSSTINYFAIQAYPNVTGFWNTATGICPTDSNGNIYYRCVASGSNTLTVTLRIWGYYI